MIYLVSPRLNAEKTFDKKKPSFQVRICPSALELPSNCCRQWIPTVHCHVSGLEGTFILELCIGDVGLFFSLANSHSALSEAEC